MNKNNTDNKHISAKQLVILEQLTQNPNIEDVARITGTARGTIYRWLKEPIFKTELTARRTEILEQGISIIKSHCNKAVNKVLSLINSDDEAIALKASCYLLDKALVVKQVQEFEERIISIEEIIEMRFPHE